MDEVPEVGLDGHESGANGGRLAQPPKEYLHQGAAYFHNK